MTQVRFDGQLQGGGGGSAISAPSEPATDSALIYLKGQDGKGAGITITDSSGNGHDAPTTTTVKQILPHPIEGKVFSRITGAIPTFPDTGEVLNTEASLELLVGPNLASGGVYFGQDGTHDLLGLNFSAKAVQVHLAAASWTTVTDFDYNERALFHVVRTDSGAQSIWKLYCNGKLIYTSAATTRLAAGTAGRIIFTNTNLEWSHLRLWNSARTEEQIQAAARLFNPLWGVA